MARINVVARKDLEGALRDPILNDDVALASFRQLGIDPLAYAQNIVVDADAIREIESSGGRRLTRWLSGNDTTARGDFQITKDTLPTLFQRYLNTAFETGTEPPEWLLTAADADKITTKADKEKFHPKGVGWLVGGDAVSDPLDLTVAQQRVLYATGKNRSIFEGGDREVYKDAIEQGDSPVLSDMYMKYWHRGTEDQASETEAARNRSVDVYEQYAAQLVEPEQETTMPESESNLMSGLLATHDQAMQPTPVDPISPQPSLAGANFGLEDRRERQGMMDGLGVDMPTRQRVPSELPRVQLANNEMDQLTDYESVMDQRLAEVSTPARNLADETYKPKSDYDKWFQEYYQNYKNKRTEELAGGVRAVAGGLTFQLADEMEALLRAGAKEEGSYEEELALIREQQDRYELLNPGKALALEAAGAIPTGYGLSAGLTKIGVTKTRTQAGLEGFSYGAGSGDTFEQRVQFATVGAAAGMALGKLIDMATTPSSAGGLKTKADDLADESLPIENQAANLEIEKAIDNEIYKEVDSPRYTRKPLKEAATFGELYDGIKQAASDFYDDKLTGLSDRIIRRVSAEVGGRIQRADQAALFVVGKELDSMSKELVPVVKIINESEKAKGAMLDYAAGKMFTDKEIFQFNAIARRMTPAARRKYRTNLQAKSRERLQETLGDELSTEHLAVLNRYLAYSTKKNSELNLNVFGAKFDDDPNAANYLTFLHTRNRAQAEKLKAEGLTEDQIEARFMSDPAFETRSRGRYANVDDPLRPSPLEYDNPIISDMRRIHKMEQFYQLQKKFGVKVDEAAEVFERSLTLDEFLDEFAYTLERKGISRDGAFFTRQQISDHIMGTAKTPHPLIQAANSLAYAVTLAGPMSAILNIADIPLLGAKYGGGAVKEGLKVVSPFKKPPNPDLEKMGLNNQTFGEFVNLINDQIDNQQGWMARTAEKMRKGADFMMKGSGFAAMDRVGKQGVMRGVLKSAADDAEAGQLANNWGFYFNEAELGILEGQLKKHGMEWQNYTGKGSELIEELMFAGLGQQQLISAAGRPSAWARHPNLRPLWALRGFVIKQQALALREVMGNIKAGKPEEAVKFLGRYAAYGAGGYAVINEGRQFIFGDGEASFGGLARGYGDAWASLLTANTLGLNDYQFGQIKNLGILPTFALGMEPIATGRARDLISTGIEVLDKERPPQAMLTEIPLFKQSFRAGRNISELLGQPEAQGMFEEALRNRNN